VAQKGSVVVRIHRNVIYHPCDRMSHVQDALETMAKSSSLAWIFSRRSCLALGTAVLLLALPSRVQAQAQSRASSISVQPQAQPMESLPASSAVRGKDLFSGQVRFQNGGPPCASCHSIAGLPFPGGGTLGPDLTREYDKLGPQGIQVAMKTLYFPVMDAIYGHQQLTPEEQADLLAFFQQATSQKEARGHTQVIILIALGIFVILLLLTRFLWRDRLQSVRRKMVERAMREGGSSS
jgi:mono/diheme cytochrome c family protein